MSITRLTRYAVTMLLVGTVAASADVVLDEQIFGPSPTNWGTSSSSSGFTPTKAIGFAGFDGRLGTLTSVIVSIQENVAGTVNITNHGLDPTDVGAALQNRLKVVVPGRSVISLLDESGDYSTTLDGGASSGVQTVSGSNATTSPLIADAASLSMYLTSWHALVGDLGQVLVSANNSNGTATYTDQGQAILDVTYTYTPSLTAVPEPATIVLLATGLLGCGVVRHRRN